MYKKYFKRILDLILALIALPFWLIILIIIGPIIYLQDKGPIFYNAPRLGKDGKIFTMYKFRSMRVNAPDIRNEDGSTYNSEDDPRLTKIGKFIRKTSLDETPQLLNIIHGDMSIIGPRPDLPEHRLLYEGNEERKLEVRPGVSGYNQAYYRNTVPWKERIQHDIYYIDHLSLWLDMKIFLKTAVSVLKREDIYVVPPNCGNSVEMAASNENHVEDEKNIGIGT
jgi:undecaprenyl phosphate N,N'-diacetylbacillosamine 1-phosphate transferase